MKRQLTQSVIVLSLAYALSGCASDIADGDTKRVPPSSHDSSDKPSVLLVHGAWADAQSWEKVTDLLLNDGYSVTAIENPLTSLVDDIATTHRAIEAAAALGPVVVVGHSYGGAVVTGAANHVDNVKALVYVNAFAPDADETVGQLAMEYPSELGTALTPDAAGFLFIDRDKFHDVFCGDLPARQARVLAASQKPVLGAAFAEPMPESAWRTLPSYYVIGTRDHAISPNAQRFMAKRIGAQTLELDASHVSFISQFEAVGRFIERAAEEN